MPARHAISLPNGRVIPVSAKEAAIWAALWRSYPEPACVGTLARLAWPADDLPPAHFESWTHRLSAHVHRLRIALRGTGLVIEDRQGWRYRLTISSPAVWHGAAGASGGMAEVRPGSAAHLQTPQQHGDVGQQDAGQEREQQTVEQRGCSPAARQSVSVSLGALHAPTMEDNR